MFEKEKQAVEDRIREFCSRNDIPLAELKWTSIPFSGEWGMSTSFFAMAAKEARSGKKIVVAQRAQEIAELIESQIGIVEGISHIMAVKGYLNLYFSSSDYARRVVDEVLTRGPEYGRGSKKNERVMVEYAQPNTHHSFHIGHYRNTILGESLARLVEFAGFEMIRASYPGDIGLGVIRVLWAYEKYYKGQEPQGIHERGQWLSRIYVEATTLLDPKENENPDEQVVETPEEKSKRDSYNLEVQEMYHKWDSGDPYVRGLWRKTREWSLEELRDILSTLDVKIDVWFFESEVDEPAKEIVAELIAKGIADDERPQGGAVIVKIDEKLGLTKPKYNSNILLRSDGTTLYLTKDLALAKMKFEQYHVDRSIYVVDVRQSMHLQQAFAILKLWGFTQAEKCHHLDYGFVSLPGGAMSARRGLVVLFKDVMDEAIRRALAVESEKAPHLSEGERAKVAEQIGLGALAYSMLSVDNSRDIVFDMDKALSFDGHTGPYIQNAHVRATSILRKANIQPSDLKAAAFNYELTSHEINVVEKISRFPAVVEQAAQEYRPLVVASYAYDLADAFHSLYHAVPVLQSEESIRTARLRLVAAAKQTLANALRLLDIQAPDLM
jgi:arginyl-tRNA synthetase